MVNCEAAIDVKRNHPCHYMLRRQKVVGEIEVNNEIQIFLIPEKCDLDPVCLLFILNQARKSRQVLNPFSASLDDDIPDFRLSSTRPRSPDYAEG
jgi:hypothetical protein